jgi:hypothetical protein
MLSTMNKGEQNQTIIEILSAYNSTDLAQAIGALQLLPDNAARTIRLEYAAEAIAAIKPNDSPNTATSHRWREWLNDGVLVPPQLTMLEDPVDNPFTEAFTFHGGSYIVMPGIVEEAAFILRQLSKAVFLRRDDEIKAEFRASGFYGAANRVMAFVFRLSDMIATKAGLTAGMGSESSLSGPVVIPSNEQFDRLKQAVTLSDADLQEALTSLYMSEELLSHLVIEQGAVAFNADKSPDDYEVTARPILKCGNDHIVIAPLDLLAALRHTVIRLAHEYDVVSELANAYHEATLDTALHLFQDNRIHEVAEAPHMDDPEGVTRRILRFDSDKACHLVLLSDTLADYPRDHPFGSWDCDEAFNRIVESLKEMERNLFCSYRHLNEVLHIVLFQGVGRTFISGIGDDRERTGHVLMLRVSDLETITLLEPGNPLLLWQFARAHEKIRENVHVTQTNILDEFRLYRDSKHSYYFSDDAAPNLLWISPGGAKKLRMEVVRRRGFFGTTSSHGTTVTEVTLLYDDDRIPIYTPWPIKHKQVELLVRVADFNIWVISPPSDTFESRYWSYYTKFIDMISYWLWQLSPTLETFTEVLAERTKQIVLEVNLLPDEHWFNDDGEDAADETHAYEDVDVSHLRIKWAWGIRRKLATADNEGEREVLRVVLQGIRRLLERTRSGAGEENLGDDRIAALIDEVAPLGPKKKLLIIENMNDPCLIHYRSAPNRLVQDSEEQIVLDEIGEYVTTTLGLTKGPIPSDRAFGIIESVVDHIYTEFTRLVASIRPDFLLEWLVEFNERLVYEQATLHLTMPTRLACFGQFEEVVEKISHELPEVSKALTAGRFLIEYVTSCPPRGIRTMSLGLYDRLLALSAMLISWGFNGDIVRLGLSDSDMSVLGSGRLGLGFHIFDQAVSDFRLERALGEIEHSELSFSRYWEDRSGAGKTSPVILELDAATKVEFGISLTDLQTFLMEAVNMCLEKEKEVLTVRVEEFTERMEGKLKWSGEKVKLALDLFASRPRNDFLDPPAPFSQQDVYPWRFGRPLSYLRKPLLIRESEGKEELIWGLRNTFLAGGNLVNTCLSGRLGAKSTELRRVVARIKNDEARRFNDKVAQMLERSGRGIVRRRVTKVGRQRLERAPGQPIGDIDVLFVIPEERRIVAIDTKSLEVARTPAETAQELAYLFGEKSEGKSSVERHLERAKWLRDNVNTVLQWLGIQERRIRSWSVEAMFVIDRELISDKLVPQSLKVVSLREFKAQLGLTEE